MSRYGFIIGFFILYSPSIARCTNRKITDYSAEQLYQIGKNLRTEGEYQKAVIYFRESFKKDPLNRSNSLELAFAHLACAHFTKGFELLDSHFQETTPLPKQWHGEDLTGKSILIHSPHWGYGDMFMMMRFIKSLRLLGSGSIIISALQSLLSFLQSHHYVDFCVPCCPEEPGSSGSYCQTKMLPIDITTIPQYDYEVHLWSLPALLGIKQNTIPTPPYLQACPQRSSAWRSRLSSDQKLKVGVCWQGAQRTDLQMQQRPIPFELLKNLFSIPNTTFYSLQVGPGLEQINAREQLENFVILPHLDSDCGAFEDTAALIENLDLIISIDTSIAHLAAGLGKKVFVLLAYAADWRYLLTRTDSPWYPTMKLFRQPDKGDWISVINHVRTELVQLAQACTNK